MKTVNALETSNLKELSEKNFVQVEPLIEHFLPGMGVFLFCGSSKIGKSWMALQIGLCVATGTKFWNYDVRKKDVLYLCLEDGERRLQDRVFSTAEEYPDNFIYTTNADAIGKGLEDQLQQQLNEHPNIGLIIIDTLAVHHVRKMKSSDPFEDISGTNGLFGSSDGAFIFRKETYEDENIKLFSRCRDFEERVLTLKFDNTTCKWDLVKENTPVEDAFQTDEDLKRVVNYVNEHGSFEGSATELCELIQAAKKPQSISGKLQNRKGQLLKMGIVFKREHTRDGSHLTLTKVELPKPGDFITEDNNADDLPYEVLDPERDELENEQDGKNNTVTSSQSSQKVSNLRRVS